MCTPIQRCRHQGFFIVEALVAFAIFSTAVVTVFVYLHRMDMNMARTRVEAHLGMICNQYQELYRNVPWDALSDAANAPQASGYVLFDGGSRASTDVPYRAEVNIQYLGSARNPRTQQAWVTVDVYWSPPNPTKETALVPTAGEEVEFRRIVITRNRY